MGGATTTTTKFSSSSFSSSMREKKETRVFFVHQTRRLPFFFFLLRINKQRGEGGKKNEEDEDRKNRRKKNRSRRSSISFVFFCSSVLPCLCFDLKISPYHRKEKKASLTEKVTFLLFYIAPHKTRAQNAKHSPLSRSKIHIFDSYILQVKRSTRAAINGSFAHHPQTNKRIVIWKGKKIPSSIFFYKKRP